MADSGRGAVLGNKDGLCLALLWLSGVCMRLSILVVPPIIPQLHADLALSQTQVGILSALPSLLLALAAIPGALFVARLGAPVTIVAGMLVAAAASALRAGVAGSGELFAATVVMGLGLSIMQPAMPQLVRTWMPRRIGYATAMYMSGLLVGQVIAVWATPALVLPLVDGDWRRSLLVWALPVVVIAIAVWVMAPGLPGGRSGRAQAGAPGRAPGSGQGGALMNGRRWWPDWRKPLVWQLGLLTGSVNSLYFTMNFFLPDYLVSRGEADWVSTLLTSLNLGQIPGSFLMLAVAGRWGRQRAAYVVSAMLALAGMLGVLFTHGPLMVAFAFLFGGATTITFVLCFALPALLSAPDDVHRTAAAMFTLSYSCAVVTPVLGGFLWDLTGLPLMAFAPVLVWPLVTWGMTVVIDLGHQPTETSARTGGA